MTETPPRVAFKVQISTEASDMDLYLDTMSEARAALAAVLRALRDSGEYEILKGDEYAYAALAQDGMPTLIDLVTVYGEDIPPSDPDGPDLTDLLPGEPGDYNKDN